ncbi:MAG: large subunit ribosomal protein L23 [Puniceicoccaceae bacterium 5H]|nr:MAG: large subunit ribosomal protein L23 [Puniceicoccaceae bacterium 5H]
MAHAANILIEPLLTEKATEAQSNLNQYTFKVMPHANATAIKQAIEEQFEVKVEAVQTVNVKPKFKMNRMRRGVIARRTPYKKAIVRLKEGQTIELV